MLPQATAEPSLRRAMLWATPAAICTYFTPAGSGGTLHWPSLLSPQAATDPSLQRTRVWAEEKPFDTSTKERPLGVSGQLHWLYGFHPQATSLPSLRNAALWPQPVVTMT